MTMRKITELRGVSVEDTVQSGPGQVAFLLSNGRVTDTVALPPGPEGQPGRDGANVLPTDEAIADAITLPESHTHAALNRAIAPRVSGIESVQPLLSRVKHADASMLVIGDSTGNEASEWVHVFCERFAAQYGVAVDYRLWNDATGTYGSEIIGTGARTLTVFNAAIAGATSQSWQAARYQAAIRAVPADLVVISLGHNEQPTPSSWHGRMLSLTERLAAERPGVPLVLVGQNPARANSFQGERVEVYKRIAAARGYGFIDVHAAFTAEGGDLTADGIHPTPEGSRLWAGTVMDAFQPTRGEPRTQPLTPLLARSAQNLTTNGHLTEWDGNTPVGWSFALSTPTRVTDSETGGVAVRAVCEGVGGNIQIPFDIATVAGRTITVAVRLKIAAGASSSAGRLGIIDSTASNIQIGEAYPTEAWRWMIHTATVSPTATSARIHIYNGGVGDTITIDRIVTVEGTLPSDSVPPQQAGGIQETGWVTPAGLEVAGGATADALRVNRVGSQVFLQVINLALPAGSTMMVCAQVPNGFRSTAGVPPSVSGSMTQVLATGDANPKNLQYMTVSLGSLWWVSARDLVADTKSDPPGRIDGVLMWTTADYWPA